MQNSSGSQTMTGSQTGGQYVADVGIAGLAPVRLLPRGSAMERDPLYGDLREAFARSELWLNLAWKDIRARYRRTVIGPFWTVLSTGTLVGALGFVNATIWKMEISEYLPFFCAGYISWLLFLTILNESGSGIIAEQATIKAMRIPYSVFVFRVITRNLIVFLHNMLIFILVAVIFRLTLTPSMLLLPVGLALAIINYAWISLLLGVVCTRFRDVIQLIANLSTILFFITPIFWHADQLDSTPIAKFILVDANFSYHLVDVIRAPLLGKPIELASILYLSASAVFGLALTWMFLRHFYNRIAYWV